MPRWLALFPWIVMACALLFSASVVALGVHTARRESDFTVRMTLGKGASLISALEGTLRTGMGFHWSDEVLRDLLAKVGRQPDIVSLAITNAEGRVLMAADPAQVGTQLLSPVDLKALHPDRRSKWNVGQLADGTEVFQVYRRFFIPQREQGLHGRRLMQRYNESCGMLDGRVAGGEPLIIFVEYDLSPFKEAQAADERHLAVMFGILVFIGVVGGVGLLLVRGYRRSRRLVQQTTAFSGEILRTLPVGIISTDQAERITSINPAALEMTGLKLEEALGQDLPHLLPGVWSVLEGRPERDTAREQEAWCLFAGNRRIPLGISASHIVTEDGEILGRALIMRDLGEIRRLQSELRRRDRLVALGNMAAGIAHEVRNPLSAIKGLARFFMETVQAGSEEARMAEIMTGEVLRLDKVVGDLLDFARPDVLNLTDMKLDELVERAGSMVRADMESRSIAFKVDLPAPPPVVRLDRDRMTQVLLNLFLNAVQAMPDGGTLRVEGHMEGTDLALTIADTGCGIPEGRLGDIFSPYFTTKAKGTGLGLSIVHKIVEAHDGTIEVSSTTGVGTTFRLRFPLAGELSGGPADSDHREEETI